MPEQPPSEMPRFPQSLRFSPTNHSLLLPRLHQFLNLSGRQQVLIKAPSFQVVIRQEDNEKSGAEDRGSQDGRPLRDRSEGAMRTVEGTARSMGIEVVEG